DKIAGSDFGRAKLGPQGKWQDATCDPPASTTTKPAKCRFFCFSHPCEKSLRDPPCGGPKTLQAFLCI
ncbi:MAG: hypothetical protein KJ556_10190, partial [Gammaproteobacteria bacterium]|nr:hypothetical protein [Gammaproteobacteria bacterium]